MSTKSRMERWYWNHSQCSDSIDRTIRTVEVDFHPLYTWSDLRSRILVWLGGMWCFLVSLTVAINIIVSIVGHYKMECFTDWIIWHYYYLCMTQTQRKWQEDCCVNLNWHIGFIQACNWYRAIISTIQNSYERIAGAIIGWHTNKLELILRNSYKSSTHYVLWYSRYRRPIHRIVSSFRVSYNIGCY